MTDSAGTRRVRVLVVDDDEGVRMVITQALEGEGFTVEPVSNGDAALQSVRRAAPDLMLLDVNMPGVDGWQVLSDLRAAAGPQTPVVVMTAGFVAQDRALASGAQGFLSKPFELDELIGTVEAHAGLHMPGGSEQITRRS